VGSSEGREAAVQGAAESEVAPVLIEAATDTLDGASANRCGDGRVVLHERQQARFSMVQGSRGGSVCRLTSQRLWCSHLGFPV
jgi:hypothetical protein